MIARARFLLGIATHTASAEGRVQNRNQKRKFKPNVQKVRAVIDGKVCRIKVSAKAIRMGLVEKPPKRNYKPAEKTTD